MPSKVETSFTFDKAFKRLSRKYPKMTNEVEDLISRLEADEREGDRIQNLGEREVYKVRLRNPDAKSGKSGGFRVIYYVKLVDMILLLTIYSKSEQEDISTNAILNIIEEVGLPDEGRISPPYPLLKRNRAARSVPP
jgi:mRNA-degrading endonuclease RelE of RelBE toxin-antitoxin system